MTSMESKIPVRRRKARVGTVWLETALIILPLFGFFMGLCDISLVLFLQSSFQNATREAVRFGITFSPSYTSPNGTVTDCTASQTTCIIQVLRDYSSGFLSPPTDNQYIVINYYTPADLTNPTLTCVSSASGSVSCTPNGTLPVLLPDGTYCVFRNAPGNIVEVVIRNYPWNWMIPLNSLNYYGQGYSTGTTISASSSDVLEGLTTGATTPPNP